MTVVMLIVVFVAGRRVLSQLNMTASVTLPGQSDIVDTCDGAADTTVITSQVTEN